MYDIYREISALLQRGDSLAVATIFDKSGSAPRTEGAKMVVRADGSIVGTIGGGRLEARVIERAVRAISDRETAILSFDLTSEDAAGSDMICGGSGEVLIDFIDAGAPLNLEIYEAAARIMGSGAKGWLVTVLGLTLEDSSVMRQQGLVMPDGTLLGKLDCDPYLMEKLVAGPAKITLHSEAFGGQRFLVEPLRSGGTVYIFGAGHISQKLAPLCEGVGFKTVVFDDREDYANRDRFPIPIEIVVIDSFKRLPELAIDSDSYLVIVSRGHLYDKHILEQVLRTQAAYIGMIGSRRKRDLVYEEILSHGVSQEDLIRVHAPIGTNIGAETPEELAISIVGELIQVRAEKGPHSKQSDATAKPCCEIRAT